MNGRSGVRCDCVYETWIRHNSNAPLLYAVLFNYSVVLTEFGDLQSARACLERAIVLNPEFAPPQINLGTYWTSLAFSDLALLQWSTMVDRLRPVTGAAIALKSAVLHQIARVLESRNQDPAADEMLRQKIDIHRDQRGALAHFPSLRQRQCEWPVVSPWTA